MTGAAQSAARAGDMGGVVPLIETCPGSSEALRRKALRALGTLPPFSPILNRLMATLAGDNVSFSALGDLIEKDTVVAGNLLRLVNSALFGRRGTVNSVRYALTLLGIDKLRNAVLGMSLTKMWSHVAVPRRWSVARFNMHASAVAILSDLVAQKLAVDYPEGAFVAGLLHDLGQLLIATGLPEEYGQIAGADRVSAEREVLGFTHSELSAEALAIWNLPREIQIAVLYHHEPEADPTPEEGSIRLSRVVAASNRQMNSMGVSIEEGGDPKASGAGALAELGLAPDEVERTLAEFQAEYEGMAQYFRF